MRSHSQLVSSSRLRTKTQDRVRMKDELQKALKLEAEEEKHRSYQKRKQFGDYVSKNYVPEVSQKKREEMQKILHEANAPAKEKVPKIRYRRPPDSILNKSDMFMENGFGSSIRKQQQTGTPDFSDDEGNHQHARTLAFGVQREESGGEYSPSRAYLPRGELEIVQEKWKNVKKRKKTRSRSSLNSQDSDYNIRNSSGLRSQPRNLPNITPPVDWLSQRRKIRQLRGDNYTPNRSIPQKLSGNKVVSYYNIKAMTDELGRKASKIEREKLEGYNNSESILRDVVQVGEIYENAIKAKANTVLSLL